MHGSHAPGPPPPHPNYVTIFHHTGSCCFVVLAALPQTRKLFSHIQEEFVAGVNKRQTTAFLIGGSILGVGMALAGAVWQTPYNMSL